MDENVPTGTLSGTAISLEDTLEAKNIAGVKTSAVKHREGVTRLVSAAMVLTARAYR